MSWSLFLIHPTVQPQWSCEQTTWTCFSVALGIPNACGDAASRALGCTLHLSRHNCHGVFVPEEQCGGVEVERALLKVKSLNCSSKFVSVNGEKATEASGHPADPHRPSHCCTSDTGSAETRSTTWLLFLAQKYFLFPLKLQHDVCFSLIATFPLGSECFLNV